MLPAVKNTPARRRTLSRSTWTSVSSSKLLSKKMSGKNHRRPPVIFATHLLESKSLLDRKICIDLHIRIVLGCQENQGIRAVVLRHKEGNGSCCPGRVRIYAEWQRS